MKRDRPITRVPRLLRIILQKCVLPVLMVEKWVSNKKVNAQTVYQEVTALSQAPKHPLVNVMLDLYAMEVQYLQDQLME